jgi:hypothetical protein
VKLPTPESLLVEQEKVCEYLLNSGHPYGAGKAKFFLEFGFSLDEWEVFADALLSHGRDNPVARTKETPFGPRYEVEGEIQAPDGRRPSIRTVWQHDHGAIAPRLITAYPLVRRL